MAYPVSDDIETLRNLSFPQLFLLLLLLLLLLILFAFLPTPFLQDGNGIIDFNEFVDMMTGGSLTQHR